jgi:hypothetical protein
MTRGRPMFRGEEEKYTDKPNLRATCEEKDSKKSGIPNKAVEDRLWTTVATVRIDAFRKPPSFKRAFGYKGL